MRFLATRQSLPWWLLIISVAFNVGFGTTYGVKTFGQDTPAPHAGGGNGSMSMVYLHEQLDLTPEQGAQMELINESLMTEITAARSSMRDARNALAQLLGAAEVDREAVDEKLATIGTIQYEAQRLVIEHLLQEKELLHPDQLEAFNEIIRSRICQGNGPGSGRGKGLGGGNGRGRGAGRGLGQTP